MTTRTKCSLLLVAIGLVAIWFASSQLSLAQLAEQEETIRSRIAAHPLLAWFVGFVVYFVIALVPGTRGKALVAGWLFGLWSGLLLVNGALTLAALSGFWLGRHLLRALLESRFSLFLQTVNRVLDREGAFYLLILRIAPLSFSLTNYLLGTTRVSATTFWWTTQLGLLPSNAVFVLVGSRLPRISEVAEQGWSAILSWELMAMLVLSSLVPIALHRLAKWLRPSSQTPSHE